MSPKPSVLIMVSGSFLLKFKTNLEAIMKLAFRSKRKPRRSQARRPTSPITNFILPDSSVHDVTHSLGEEKPEEYTVVVDLDLDVWREILAFCEVIDIIHIGMVQYIQIMGRSGPWILNPSYRHVGH